ARAGAPAPRSRRLTVNPAGTAGTVGTWAPGTVGDHIGVIVQTTSLPCTSESATAVRPSVSAASTVSLTWLDAPCVPCQRTPSPDTYVLSFGSRPFTPSATY